MGCDKIIIMDLQVLLKESLKEKFKNQAALALIEQQIIDKASELAYLRHNHSIFMHGLEFELGIAKASLNTNDLEYIEGEVLIDLRLVYFCKSEDPKHKKRILQNVKTKYADPKTIKHCRGKVPLWKIYDYRLELGKVLSGAFSLRTY